MPSKQAVFIKDLTGTRGDAKLYRLSDGGYVVVSAATVMGTPETYIFESDDKGRVNKYLELDGSYRGGLDHHQALENAGYEVKGD